MSQPKWQPGGARQAPRRSPAWRTAGQILLSIGIVFGGPAGAAPAALTAPPGVENPVRAWQDWTLNCQGCHRPDGGGSRDAAPPLAGTVAKFLRVPGGREYLGRVPGVASSPLSDADLAEVLNWMLWRFDRAHLPLDYRVYTAGEIGSLRSRPLRLEAARLRRELLERAGGSTGARAPL